MNPIGRKIISGAVGMMFRNQKLILGSGKIILEN